MSQFVSTLLSHKDRGTDEHRVCLKQLELDFDNQHIYICL